MAELKSESKSHSSPQDQLIQLMSPWIASLGYRIIYLEVQSHRLKVLRVFIDFEDSSNGQAIGIEDCVKVSRALDTHLDAPETETQILKEFPEISGLLANAFELEVSSPGADRPLRSLGDFEKFAGKQAQIHTYRPLTPEESGNKDYLGKNPKQKNFKGILLGLQGDRVKITLASLSPIKKSKAKKNAMLTTNSAEEVTITIPLPLISKANLEPEFSFDTRDERE